MIDLHTRRFCKVSDQNGINILFGLHDMAVKYIKKEHIICEVGSYRGVSSCLLAEFCHTLYCVDPWTPYTNDVDYVPNSLIFEAEMEFDQRSYNYSNIVKLKKPSLEACEGFDDFYFDLVYLDGSHAYNDIKKDIISWLPKIKSDGFISGHDFGLSGVQRAISETIGTDNMDIYSDSSWIKRIKR